MAAYVPGGPLRSARAAVAMPLEVDRISKSYGMVRALTEVSFAVPPGQIVGLLGPNGAGKSTTMKAVLGLLRPEAGQIRVFGRDVQADPVETKREIGYVPEAPSLYEFLTGAEYLDFVADMYGIPSDVRRERISQFLTGLELAGHEDSLISGYSQGMKQKVALIAGLLHRPRLLVLDEPLNGLDPRSARVVKDLLRSLATSDGVGVLFSTHVLEIAQAICDRVVILSHGTVLAMDTVDALRARAGLPGSGLEDVFLALTGTGDLTEVVSALSR
jgi:ABC-2 type transport system ATP-binding protein